MKKFQKVAVAGSTWWFLNGAPVLAASELPDGEGVKNGVVDLGGNILIIVCVIMFFKGIFSQRWGQVVTTFLGAALMAWVLWMPDSFESFLKSLVEAFGG